MADKQVGTIHGFAAVGGNNRDGGANTKLSDITADGINTVTVSDLENIRVGQTIDIVNKADGTVLAANRTVDSLTAAGVLTYSGADVAATTDHGVYGAGDYGNTAQSGYRDNDSLTIASLRRRLKGIDAGLYTDDYLNMMTLNDMQYAVRLADNPATIR